MKVLIVDDEEMIRNVLKEYVEFEGNEAYEAADGIHASQCRIRHECCPVIWTAS